MAILPEFFLIIGRGELLEQFLLLFAKFGGGVNKHCYDMGTSAVAFEMWHATVGKFEISTGLSAGRYFHPYWPINRLDVDLGAESRFDHADVFFAEDEVTFAGEMFVGFDTDIDVEDRLWDRWRWLRRALAGGSWRRHRCRLGF